MTTAVNGDDVRLHGVAAGHRGAHEQQQQRCLFLDNRIAREGCVVVVAESFRACYAAIRPTLTLLAEAVSRPALMHTYRLTPFSLGAAVSSGVTVTDAMAFFARYAYGVMAPHDMHDNNNDNNDDDNDDVGASASLRRKRARDVATSSGEVLYDTLRDFIAACMRRYNQVRVVIESERTVVQCRSDAVAQTLLADAVVRSTAATLPSHIQEQEREVTRPTVANDDDAASSLSRVLAHGLFYWKDEIERCPYFLLQSRAMAKVVAARCVVLGYPIQQQYSYERDTAVRTTHFSLRSQTRPRGYQVEAVDAATSDGTVKSGCLLLPCGAGKTLVGIMLMCKVRKPTLIVCAGAVSVEQWRNQILDCASLDPAPAHSSSGSGISADTAGTRRATSATAAAAGDTAASRARLARNSGAARIACLTGKQKDDITADGTDVVLTTYSMLVSAYKTALRRQAHAHQHHQQQEGGGGGDGDARHYTAHGTRKRKLDPKEQLFASYGLLLLDEVHVIPAEAFREALGLVDAKAVIGLTATYVREDHRIMDLFHLVGPKLYDISMESLVAQGYLAEVNCVEVHTPMTREFGIEYLERSAPGTLQLASNNSSRRGSGDDHKALATASSAAAATTMTTGHVPALVLLAAANPYKMLCVHELVTRHLANAAKILVFCDHIMLLHEYGRLLRAPVICGATPHRERLMIFSDFQSTATVNVICISRVGDVSVDLPSASVVIQVSSHGGSRRQEAQRLGRILRPKERSANGRAVEAWFYSIISMDTLEMTHAARRTAFLVDQGYACRIMQYAPAHATRAHAGGTVHAAQDRHDSATHHHDDDSNNNNNGGGAMRGVKKADEAHVAVKQAPSTRVVGDALSIKQEAMHGTLHGTTLLRDAASGAADEEARSLSYQLSLLSKVVSSWEMAYQQASREQHAHDRARLRDEADVLTRGRHRDDDDDVVEVRPQRGLRAIKREFAGTGDHAATTSSTTAARSSLSSAAQAVPLADLVGVEDGFVYHEL